jgi:predicted lipid-binding transport protein (Tim44 family)
MSRWMGPLAGLAAGIGLAALFSHLGLGEGMANIMMMLLLLGAAVFFAVRWFLGRRQPAAAQPAMQYAGAGAGNAAPANFTPARFESTGVGAGATAAAAASAANIPADFDVDGFLRQAKLNFIRLQAANDRGDMEDIRQFCSPEMAAEIQMQFQERKQLAQETDVVQLDAELLDVSTEANRALASVRFSGLIREEANACAGKLQRSLAPDQAARRQPGLAYRGDTAKLIAARSRTAKSYAKRYPRGRRWA